MTNTI